MTWSEPEVEAAHRVIVELASVLGHYRDNYAVVGGWVPPLLFREAAAMHVGSTDVDLALDADAIQEEAYRKIDELLKARGYYQKDLNKHPFSYFRNVDVGGTQIDVRVDLLAQEYGGTAPEKDLQIVQERIWAVKARGADLLFRGPDPANMLELKGLRPDGSEDTVRVKVAGILPFLVMKAAAMQGRDKEKDAYDIVFCIKQYPGGVEALAAHIKPHVGNGLVKEALATLQEKFESPRHRGPVHAASFEVRQEEAELEARRAYALVRDLLAAL